MLVCKKIRLQVSEQDAATLEMMQSKCRGLYNWWVMKLRTGERWRCWDAKKTLAESRKVDPDIDQVYGKLLAEVYFPAGQSHASLLHAGCEWGDARLPQGASPASVLHALLSSDVCQGGGRCRRAANWRRAWQENHKPYPTIVARLSETPPAGYKEVAISRDARGNYHASFVYLVQEADQQSGHIIAIDLGIKTLATGYNGHGRFYHIGGFKGHQWYNKQLDKIRSKRDRCQKKSRRYIHLSQVYRRVSEQKRSTNSGTVCTRPLISSLTNWLQELL